jgi:hypothetical protein
MDTKICSWRVRGYGLIRMPRDLYIRDKFTREISHARNTVVESWADIQSYNIEFVMKRLREPKAKP